MIGALRCCCDSNRRKRLAVIGRLGEEVKVLSTVARIAFDDWLRSQLFCSSTTIPAQRPAQQHPRHRDRHSPSHAPAPPGLTY